MKTKLILILITVLIASCTKLRHPLDGIDTYHVAISPMGEDSVSVIIYDSIDECLAEAIVPNTDSTITEFINSTMNPYYYTIKMYPKDLTEINIVDDEGTVYQQYRIHDVDAYILDSLCNEYQNTRWDRREKATLFMDEMLYEKK